MISTTACDLASSRRSRWFSARSRPGSFLPAGGSPGPVRPPGRRRPGIERVASRRPFPDLRLIQAIPPQHRGLLPVRRRLILRDHPRPELRGKRPADRTRRRIGHPAVRAVRSISGTLKG